jgi:hypothetical protein
LFVIGSATAAIAGSAAGAGLLFWAAVVIAGIGAAMFLSGLMGR